MGFNAFCAAHYKKYMWKIILLAWIAGISLMGKTYVLSTAYWILLGLACLISILFYRRYQSGIKLESSTPWLFKAGVTLLLAIFTFSVAYGYADRALEQRLSQREGKIRSVEAIVYIRHIDERSDKQIRQRAQVLGQQPRPVQWSLSFKNQPDETVPALTLGQYYRIYGEVRPAHGYALPGVFDQEKWLIQQNIMATVRVEQLELLSTDEVYRLGLGAYIKQQRGLLNRFLLLMEQQRLYFRNALQQAPLDNRGLALALLSGDKSLLSSETEAQFKRLGISHLLAISGPHVLIFAALVSWLLRACIHRYWPELYLRLPRPYLLVLPFCCCVLLYSAFVGFEIPALRTLLITLIGSMLLLLQQQIRALSLLLISASVLLWIDPFSVLSAAFWLSFGACFVLLRIYESLDQQQNRSLTSWPQKIYRAIQLLVESQGKIFLALFPLVLIFFKQVTWIAPLTNILVIPLLGAIVVPIGILAACLSYISTPLGLLLFHLGDLGLSLCLWILQGLDQVFTPQLQALAFTPTLIVSCSIGLLIIYLPRSVLPKSWAVLCFVPLAISTEPDSKFKLTVLDVGQGQAVLLQNGRQKLMLDTGGYYDESKFSIGQQVLVPFLSTQGISRLDRVILTHLDQDHSGALRPMSQNIHIHEVMTNTRLPRDWQFTEMTPCQAGQSWSYPGFKLQVLSPEPGTTAAMMQSNPNESSCVLYVQVFKAQPYQNFLIMGDTGWPTEYRLLQQYPDLKVDVLILGHHGSKHSSSYAFLKQLQPKLAIASAGLNNRYGHPTAEVKARLHDLGIPLLTTIESGNIEFNRHANGQVSYSLYRQQWKWLH